VLGGQQLLISAPLYPDWGNPSRSFFFFCPLFFLRSDFRLIELRRLSLLILGLASVAGAAGSLVACFDFDVSLAPDPNGPGGAGSNPDGSTDPNAEGGVDPSGSRDGGADARYCPPRSANGFDVDLTMAAVTGSFTVAAGPHQSTSNGYGQVTLRTPEGDVVPLGNSHEDPYQTKYLLTGKYDAYFTLTSLGSTTSGGVGPGTSTPHNMLAPIATGITIKAGTNTVDLDIPMTNISGGITVNGAAGTNQGYGQVTLRTPALDALDLGVSYSTNYGNKKIVPGAYEVWFSNSTVGTGAPSNSLIKIGNVAVKAGTLNSINVDVPMATLSGNITVAGMPPQSALMGYGRLVLRGATSTVTRQNQTITAVDEVLLGPTSSSTYTTKIVPGTYNLDYELQSAGNGTGAPINKLARLRTGVVVAAGTSTLNIDVPMVQLSGNVTLATAPPPPSSSGYGNLIARLSANDEVLLGPSYSPTFKARVVPGTYEIAYKVQAQGTAALNHTVETRFKSNVVVGSGGAAVNVDIPMATIGGSITVGGDAPGTTTQGYGRIVLRSSDGGEVDVASTAEKTYASRRLLPGEYDVYYAVTTPGPGAPINKLALVKRGVVINAGNGTLDIDVPVTAIKGKVTINNLPPQPAANGTGNLVLRSAFGDEIVLGSTSSGTISPTNVLIVPGVYDLVYEHETPGTGTGAPLNKNANLGCFDIK
jgi:hypothetical protein